MKLSNVRKKSKEITKCEKKLSHVILELHNVRMKPSNVRKMEPPNVRKKNVTCNVETAQYEDRTIKYKKKWTTKCEKRTVTCDVGIAQCEDETVKCEKKKVRELPNVRKELSYVILELHNVRMKPSNVRKK